MAMRNLLEDERPIIVRGILSRPPQETTVPERYRVHPPMAHEMAVILNRTFRVESPGFLSFGQELPSRMAFRGIDARLWNDGEQWWALDEGGTDVFGEGDTREEAVLDLVASIGTMMADLAANRDRLSGHAADQLRRFERALAEE